ncbi:hypothetical protein [Vibrio coralliilyticus]|uniref:Uncharacterized protein n=1 Tax=Vibrio coralliilyticus TaxID=190893 RepID=A0AAP6ZLT5_9VIBR|nr:hypothetical protein [Vibrio coralliilyticus]NOJ21705.1 hypothetical protein [Vibrio coralliilyticus]
MKTKLWVFSFITALTAAGFIFWPNPVETSEYAKPRGKVGHDAVPLPEADNRLVVSKQDSTGMATSIETKAVALKLKQVAIKHQQILQYPSYSQPIVNESSPYLNWNAFEVVETPILDGKSTASLSIKKFRHFYPEQIAVELKTQQTVLGASLDVVSVATQQVLTTLPSDEMQWQIMPGKDWPEELRLIARVDFERGEDIVSADVRLYHSVASVVSVSEGYAQGPDMKIPVTLQIDKEGIFRLRANLYQKGGKAIASLVEKQRLSEGEQTVDLKAFKRVLPEGEIDLELRDVVIERMSGHPGEKAGYGQSDAESYPVGRFDSGTLTDEEYQMTEQEKQQLAFLQQLL